MLQSQESLSPVKEAISEVVGQFVYLKKEHLLFFSFCNFFGVGEFYIFFYIKRLLSLMNDEMLHGQIIVD